MDVRRGLVLAVLGVVVLLSVQSWSPGRVSAAKEFEGQTLRVAMWGGGWNRGLHEFVGKPFMEQTGAKVEYVIGNPREHLAKMIATRGQEPPFDVVQVDDSVREQVVRLNLVEKLDLSKIPNARHVVRSIVDQPELGPTFMIIPVGIAYNTEKFKEAGIPAPTSWDVLWDPKIAGKVAIPDLNVVMGVHTLMAAAQRASGNPYDYDAGIAELKKIKLNHIYSSPVEVATQVTAGNVWALAWSEGRANELRFRNFPVRYVNALTGGKKGSMDLDTIHVVRGAKQKPLAEIYINMTLDTDAQLKFAKAEGWTPAVTPALEALKADPVYRERLAILDEKGVDEAFRADWKILNKNWSDIVSKWNRALKQ
jgi:putative spermidine/putrescine transport system substrate-binding protein